MFGLEALVGLVVLVLYLLGVACVAYGLSLIYAPLAPIWLGSCLFATAYASSRTLPRGPS